MLKDYIIHTQKIGDDITCWMLFNELINYEGNLRHALSNEIHLLQNLHDCFDSDEEILKLIGDSCIIGEAYNRAAQDIEGCVPSTQECLNSLRMLILEYENDGFVFSGEIYEELTKGWKNARKVQIDQQIYLAREIASLMEIDDEGIYFISSQNQVYICNLVQDDYTEEYLFKYYPEAEFFTGTDGKQYFVLMRGNVYKENTTN